MFRREIVSESRGYSDSINPKKWNRVRIKEIFGQQWHEEVESCPNQGDIRTAMARKGGIVSESRGYSDSNGTKRWNRVRIKGIFGQQWHEKVESCPNQGDIRTGLTRKREIMSESRGYSDSNGTKRWNRVRIKGIFGQQWHEKGGSCPNKGHIQTAFIRKSESVSKSNRLHENQTPIQ
jgi:hypothetical protein